MATDFFAAQDTARSRTRRLVVMFLASVLGLIVVIYLAIMLLFTAAIEDGGIWDPAAFGWIAISIAVVVGVSSLWKISSLQGGGGSVAVSVGGRRVEPDTLDNEERRLINIVEEMAIAAGIPVPEIYILEGQQGINAFAAGFSTKDAAVAVTRGCIRKLTRDELQGVVAHEFSHILNGDMRLNIQLIGLVFGLLVLTIIGQICFRIAFYSGNSSRRKSNGKGGDGLVFGLLGLGVILYVSGWAGVLFGRLMQSAVSRQREYLADASAVQFTRNPDGLAGALKKIASEGSMVENVNAQDIAHLFFANGLRRSWWGLFATHPPIEERILALDPAWDGKVLQHSTVASESAATVAPPPLPRVEATPPPLPKMVGGGGAGMALVGTAMSQLSQAQAVHTKLRHLFRDEWRDPAASRDIVMALLPPLSAETEPAGVLLEREKLVNVEPTLKTTLVSMLMPALGRLPAVERQEMIEELERLESVEMDAFTFGVWWIVRRNLQRMGQKVERKQTFVDDPSLFAGDVSTLLSALLHVGGAGEEAARMFNEAIAASPSFEKISSYPQDPVDLSSLDEALEHLGRAAYGLRKEIIAAATAAVMGDGQIVDSEIALMQLVSIALDCPASLPGSAASTRHALA